MTTQPGDIEFGEAIGRAVQAARKAAGLSQVALAMQVGVTGASISALEAMGVGTKSVTLARIAVALNVSIAALIPVAALEPRPLAAA